MKTSTSKLVFHFSEGDKDQKDQAPQTITSLTEPGRTGQFPTGTYRYTLTAEYLASIEDYDYDRTSVAVYTWKFGHGVFEMTWYNTEVDLPSSVRRGYFSVTGQVVHFTRTVDMPGGDCLPPDWRAKWRSVDGGIEWDSVVTWPSTFADFGPVFEDFAWERID